MPANSFQKKIRKNLIEIVGCTPTYSESRKNGTMFLKWITWYWRSKTNPGMNEALCEKNFLQIYKNLEESCGHFCKIVISYKLALHHYSPRPHISVSIPVSSKEKMKLMTTYPRYKKSKKPKIKKAALVGSSVQKLVCSHCGRPIVL